MKVYYYIGSSGTVYLDKEDLVDKSLLYALTFVDYQDIEANAAIRALIKEQTISDINTSHGCIDL